MKHTAFPRNGTFYGFAPLDFRTYFHFPASTVDTLSSEGLRGDDFVSLMNRAGEELGDAGLRVACWTNNWSKVLCIETRQGFNTQLAAANFVGSVLDRLEFVVSKRLQDHIRNPHHSIVFSGSVHEAAVLPGIKAPVLARG